MRWPAAAGHGNPEWSNAWKIVPMQLWASGRLSFLSTNDLSALRNQKRASFPMSSTAPDASFFSAESEIENSANFNEDEPELRQRMVRVFAIFSELSSTLCPCFFSVPPC